MEKLNTLKKESQWFIPEGEALSPKFDIYSIGLLLYHCFTRKLRNPQLILSGEFNKIKSKFWSIDLQEQTIAKIKNLCISCFKSNPELRPNINQLIDELDDIAIESVIFDPLAREYWKKNFKGKMIVPSNQLCNTLEKDFHMKVSEHNYIRRKCFTYLLGDREDFCNCFMEEFSRVLFWFGPLGQDESGSNNFLERVEYLISKRAFHGLITALEANQLLFSCPKKNISYKI